MNEQNNLTLNIEAQDALRESAKWSLFLSILGFIGIAFMLLISVFIGSLMANMPDQSGMEANPINAIKNYLGIFYAIFAIIYFFPIYYLYKYATGIKNSINYQNSDNLATALGYLKSHHKFLGILAIVVISLYLVMIIGVAIFATSMASNM